jgi:SMI1 / KNR4 family (SUKH-1)
MYLDEAKEKEEALHQIGIAKFTPCTEEQLVRLEGWYGYPLPQSYREFLLWMGSWGGGLLVGSDCFYGDLKDIQECAREILKENNFPGVLPDDAFVFWMHQGYQFLFFRSCEGENPPVYYYLEEEPARTAFTCDYPHFSDYIIQEIESCLKIAYNNAARIVEVAKLHPERARQMEMREARRREMLRKMSN